MGDGWPEGASGGETTGGPRRRGRVGDGWPEGASGGETTTKGGPARRRGLLCDEGPARRLLWGAGRVEERRSATVTPACRIGCGRPAMRSTPLDGRACDRHRWTVEPAVWMRSTPLDGRAGALSLPLRPPPAPQIWGRREASTPTACSTSKTRAIRITKGTTDPCSPRAAGTTNTESANHVPSCIGRRVRRGEIVVDRSCSGGRRRSLAIARRTTEQIDTSSSYDYHLPSRITGKPRTRKTRRKCPSASFRSVS